MSNKYKIIINPLSGRKVKSNGKVGSNTIKKYINVINQPINQSHPSKYIYMTNLKTGRKVNIRGRIGLTLLRGYLKVLNKTLSKKILFPTNLHKKEIIIHQKNKKKDDDDNNGNKEYDDKDEEYDEYYEDEEDDDEDDDDEDDDDEEDDDEDDDDEDDDDEDDDEEDDDEEDDDEEDDDEEDDEYEDELEDKSFVKPINRLNKKEIEKMVFSSENMLQQLKKNIKFRQKYLELNNKYMRVQLRLSSVARRGKGGPLDVDIVTIEVKQQFRGHGFASLFFNRLVDVAKQIGRGVFIEQCITDGSQSLAASLLKKNLIVGKDPGFYGGPICKKTGFASFLSKM